MTNPTLTALKTLTELEAALPDEMQNHLHYEATKYGAEILIFAKDFDIWMKLVYLLSPETITRYIHDSYVHFSYFYMGVRLATCVPCDMEIPIYDA